MAEYDEVIASGSVGEEMVAVPSYPGEQNPGHMHFTGRFAVVRQSNGLVKYNFGLASGMSERISVNRSMAINYAAAGSDTARAALQAVPTPK